jgi:hypothetical protein
VLDGEHPGATEQDYLRHMKSLIAQFGWAVQGVEGDRLLPPYAYTVGLTARAKPEPPAHLLTACELYGAGIRALQIVHADDRGRWPWETGYRGVKGVQPVLGPRAGTTKAS